jgi:hypothetical protein
MVSQTVAVKPSRLTGTKIIWNGEEQKSTQALLARADQVIE